MGLQNSLNRTPGRTAPGDTVYTLLYHSSPGQALQTPCSQFSFTHQDQAWQVTPTKPPQLPHWPSTIYTSKDPCELPLGLDEAA